MNKNIYFSHIPKTAGRTITDIFNEESKKKGKKLYVGEKYFMEMIIKKNKFYFDTYLKEKYHKKFIKFDKEQIKNKHWNIRFWHIPLSFWKDKLLLDLKKKNIIFCTVRNPYDRIVSDFKFWIKFYDKYKNTKYEKTFKFLLNDIETIYENNFNLNKNNLNKVITKLLKTNKYRYSLDGHLIPQHKYVYTIIDDKLIKIPDEVLHFENLEKDFIKFKKKYIDFIPNNAIRKTHLNPTQNKNLNVNNLTLSTKQLIYKYYELDFKIFNYSK